MNARGDLPGPGDAATRGIGISPEECVIDDEFSESDIEDAIEGVIDEWMDCRPTRCDYHGFISSEDWYAIEAAYERRDAQEWMRLTDDGLRKAMREDAMKEAFSRLKQRREFDQLDAAISAARSYA